MFTPLRSITTWSNTQLMENENNKDSVSTTKYNKQRRYAKVWKEEVEQRVCEEVEKKAQEEAVGEAQGQRSGQEMGK